MLTAALCRAIGIRTRFVTMGLSDAGPIAHVRAEAHDGKIWISLDLSAPSLKPGSRSLYMEVR
jgi:transglutaminase-like putative cysteine protease